MMDQDNSAHPVDNMVKENVTSKTPPDIEDLGMQHLAAFRERMKQAKTPQKESFIMTVMRKTQSRRTRWTAVAAAAALVIFFVSSLSFLGGSRVAFADVIEKLREIRPYSCTFTIERHGKRIYSQEVMRDTLTRRREIMEDGSIRVFDLGQDPVRMLTLYPDKKLAILKIYTDSEPMQDPDLLAIIANIQEGDAEDLGFKEIEGRRAQGFHRPHEINDFTIWVDTETALPLQIDLLHVQRDQRIIMTEFDFETPLDPSLFSTSAPEGYTVRSTEGLLRPEPTEPGIFRPYSCRQTVERGGKIVSEERMMRLDLSRRREIDKGGSIDVFDFSKEHLQSMKLKPEEKKAVITTIDSRKGPLKDPDLVALSVSMRDGSEEYLGWEIIEGRNAEGFRSVDPGNEITFWLDAETKLPLRVEIVHTFNNQKIVMDQFDFNVEFDESLFKIEAPEGYTVEEKTKGRPSRR